MIRQLCQIQDVLLHFMCHLGWTFLWWSSMGGMLMHRNHLRDGSHYRRNTDPSIILHSNLLMVREPHHTSTKLFTVLLTNQTPPYQTACLKNWTKPICWFFKTKTKQNHKRSSRLLHQIWWMPLSAAEHITGWASTGRRCSASGKEI